MTRFTLLHAADLHLGQVPDPLRVATTFAGETPLHVGSHDPALVKALARLAWERRGSLDALLLGGDLAATGSEGDLARAFRFATAPPGAAPWLDDRGGPTVGSFAEAGRLFVLPGNHDRDGVDPRSFDRLFARLWPVGQGARLYPTLVRDGRALQVVGLDLTARPGSASTQGRADPEVLATARHLSELARRELVRRRTVAAPTDVAVLWLVHFPPLFPRLKRSMELLEGERLVYEAERAGVLGLLAGHTHLVQDYVASGGGASIRVLCTGSAGMRHEHRDTAVQLIHVDFDRAGTARAQAEVLRWSEELAEFRADQLTLSAL